MKCIINLSVLLFVFQMAFSQDYQCIKEDVTYFYSNDIFFKAISIDSVVSAGDSIVYYNYPTITDDYIYDWCFGRIGPSWIGRYISEKQDGEHVFYNKFNNPVSIQTLYNTNEYWTSFVFENGNYVRATVLEIEEMEFLGITDTVKKISFQAHDIDGDSIDYPVNGKYILLSKNNGLVRTINFKYFPNLWGGHITTEHCSEYYLCGMREPEVGIQNLTAARIFDYEVGDEIHNKISLYGNQGYAVYDFYKNSFLQKEYSTNLDTASYLIYHCGYTEAHIPYEGIEYYYFEDTVTSNYFIGSNPYIDFLPDKLVIDTVASAFWEYSITNCEYLEGTSRLKKTLLGGYYSEYPHDCIEFLESKDGVDEKFYIEGLGYYDSWLIPWSNSGGREPIYFSQGEEEWGTPYSFNCNGYYTSINQEDEVDNLVKIAPNPMKEWTKISIETGSDSKHSFILYNSFGKAVRTYNFEGSNYMITRDGLPNGIYFYVLENSEGFKNSGKLIVQ